MTGRPPLAPVAAELAMRVLNRAVLVPLRRLVVGEDAWTSFYELGYAGRPWWHYQEGPDGRLVLVGPLGGRTQPSLPQHVRVPTRPTATAGGVSVTLSCGRVTTPIAGYRPEVHGPLVDQLDLLCVLLDEGSGSGTFRSAQRPRLSPSLAARAWGTRTGRTQRRADAYLAELGAADILDRGLIGSRAEWHVPTDAMRRFQELHGFTVAD